MSLLQPGDTFPELTVTVPGGKTVTVPETFAGQLGVVLFSTGARGALTATPSCAASSAPAPPWPTPPHGKVVVSVYSSGAIGRLVPEDVAGLVRYVREHAATSA